MSFLLLKAFHIIAVICWFAGLFYLPRLFVYHAMTEDTAGKERFCIMERKLYRGIMMPSLVFSILFGALMLAANPDYLKHAWMHIKLGLVILLIVYHFICGLFVKAFAEDRNTHSHIFFRWFNEVPVIFLIIIVMLVVIKPL